MRAFKLYIGSDNASHVLEGEVALMSGPTSSPCISRNRHRIPHWIGTSRRSGNTSSR